MSETGPETGPGTLSAREVGTHTVANTTLLDERLVMAYATSINDQNEAYFDDTRPGGLNVHPGIVFSLQWNSRFRPGQPVNMRAAPYGVHAHTDLSIVRPFSCGEAITTQGRLIARQQIPPGVYSVERYTMRDAKGDVIAILDYNGITRGATLEGDNVRIDDDVPEPAFEPTSEGEPDWIDHIHVPRHAGQQYTECARIYNPIHTERSVALAAGLPDIILHGSATKAMALSSVIQHCFEGDARRITRLSGQLRAMVLMNTDIRVVCHQVSDDETERKIRFSVLNQDSKPAIANGFVVGRL